MQKILKYCVQKEISVKTEKDIRWVELQQYMLEDDSSKEKKIYKDFLECTLVEDYFERFRKIFQSIDMEGYFGKNIYEEVMKQKITVNGEERDVPITQIRKYATPYWKHSIHMNSKEKTILCLDNEAPEDETVADY